MRAIGAAVVGYLLIAMISMGLVFLVYTTLGPTFAFAGETPVASVGWSLLQMVGGFIAACIGGLVAAKIGGPTGVRALIVVILVMGAVFAFMTIGAETAPLTKPVAELSFMEAGQVAVSPTWYVILIPAVGVLGVLVGSRLRKG